MNAVKPSDLYSWLSVCSNDLVSIDSKLESVCRMDVPSLPLHPRLQLVRLQDMKLCVSEDLRPDDATAFRTLESVLSFIEAPALRNLQLDIDTPYSDYLPLLKQALEQGTFANLDNISGTYRMIHRSEGWGSIVAETRRAYFIAACRKRRINIADLIWAADVPKEEPDSG